MQNIVGAAAMMLVRKVIILATFATSLIAIAEEEDKSLSDFRKMFHQKRLLQLSSIKQMMSMSGEKQLKLLDSMLTKMTAVMTESKTAMVSTGIDMSNGHLPNGQRDRTALALILENTCLASDILLRFPNYMHKKLDTDKDFDLVYKWGLGYINETASFLLDEPTQRLFFLAGQELELIEKDASYSNPYKKLEATKPKKIMFADEPDEKPKKKVKNKIKRGPRLSKTEL